jgi:branched-chain amino acid transport system ATP-binding protein
MNATSTPILEVRDLELRFGNVTAFSEVTFEVARGELFAVIGPNGAGKTSLFNVLSRVYEPTAGSARFEGADLLRLRAQGLASVGFARTFQNLGLFGDLTALENVLIGRHHLMRSGAVRSGLWLRSARREERLHRAAAMEALAFTGLAHHADDRVGTLPFGIRKRLEIARALAMEPKLMLLDEPVAGMSVEEREDIATLVCRLHEERHLTLLLVEHDMNMVMRIAQRVLVLDFGQTIALGSPAEIQRDERVIRAYLGEELDPDEAASAAAPDAEAVR